jgi:hypothetical protein
MKRIGALTLVTAVGLVACIQSAGPLTGRGSKLGTSVQGCEITFWWKSPGEMIAYPDSLPEGPNLEIARADIDLISIAVQRFCLHTGRLPRTLTELVRIGRSLPGTRCSVDLESIVDPWGKRYFYEATESGFQLASAGPDGIKRTSDDVSRPDPDSAEAERINVRELCGIPDNSLTGEPR